MTSPSDFEFLLLVLGLLYLSECLVWVRRGSVVLRTWAWGRAVVAHPSPGMGAKRTGVVPLNPLPPFGRPLLCRQWPIAMSDQAAYSHVPLVINGHDRPDHLDVLIHWDDIWKIERDGDLVKVNQKPFARCNGEALATLVAGALREIHGAPPEQRARLIARHAERAINTQRILRELRRYRLLAGGFGGIRWLAHVLLLIIFGAIPLTIGFTWARPYLLQALILLAGMLLIQAVQFFQAHRRLYPDANGTRWKATLTIIFTPTASIRACDALAKDLLAAYHPLAAAVVVCGENSRKAFARRVLLDAQHPMPDMMRADDEERRQLLEEYRKQAEAAVLAIAAVAGMDVSDLTRPPVPQDNAAKAYCPRCDGEFVIAEGACDHCGGVKLKPFATEEALATSGETAR